MNMHTNAHIFTVAGSGCHSSAPRECESVALWPRWLSVSSTQFDIPKCVCVKVPHYYGVITQTSKALPTFSQHHWKQNSIFHWDIILKKICTAVNDKRQTIFWPSELNGGGAGKCFWVEGRLEYPAATVTRITILQVKKVAVRRKYGVVPFSFVRNCLYLSCLTQYTVCYQHHHGHLLSTFHLVWKNEVKITTTLAIWELQ